MREPKFKNDGRGLLCSDGINHSTRHGAFVERVGENYWGVPGLTFGVEAGFVPELFFCLFCPP